VEESPEEAPDEALEEALEEELTEALAVDEEVAPVLELLVAMLVLEDEPVEGVGGGVSNKSPSRLGIVQERPDQPGKHEQVHVELLQIPLPSPQAVVAPEPIGHEDAGTEF